MMSLLKGIKYQVGEVWGELTFTAQWAFGSPEQKAYCQAIVNLSQNVGLDRSSMQKWFDGIVYDSGLDWKQAYDLIAVHRAEGLALHEIYQRVVGND